MPLHNDDETGRVNFPTTRWTIVLKAARNCHRPQQSSNGIANQAEQAGMGDEEVRHALESLCTDYRPAVVAFVRASGIAAADAEDIAHDFFLRFVEGDGFGKADQTRGRLRNYMLRAIGNTIRSHHRDQRAAKRGGGSPVIPLDEVAVSVDIADQTDADGPIVAYDRAWAEHLMQRALDAERPRFERRGEEKLLEDLVPMLDGSCDDATVRDEVCQRNGLDSAALSSRLHRFRRSLGGRLRLLIAATVESEEDIDEEMRYFVRILARSE